MEQTSFYPLSSYDYGTDNVLIPENYGGVTEDEVKSAAQEAASQAVAKVVAGAPEAYDTLKEVADWIAADGSKSAELTTQVSQNSTNIENVANSLSTVVDNLSTNLSSVATNLSNNITSVQNSLDSKIETVRKTADSAKQISDTAYQNDKYTRELVDGLKESKQDKGDYALNGSSYTKDESDARYLTEHQSLAEYAKTDSVYSKTDAEAMFATQTVVNEEIAGRIADKSAFEQELATKADKSDTYSKTEIDSKGFATKESVEETTNNMKALDAKVTSLVKAVAALAATSEQEDAIANVLSADATVELPQGKYTEENPLNINKTIKIQ